MACLTISASFKRSTFSENDLPVKKEKHRLILYLIEFIQLISQGWPTQLFVILTACDFRVLV